MSHNPQEWTPEWAEAARKQWPTVCPECNGTGTIDTGNNDLPCDCPAGDTALFNDAFVEGGPITGAEMKRHFLNDSPEPIEGTVRVENIPGRQGRVLVVDDDETNVIRITQYLTMVGYAVVVAHNGLEGLRAFHDDDDGFNLILSDWSMPYMMGTEMLRKIRRQSKQQKMMMMSSDPLHVRKELRELNMSDVRVLDKMGIGPQDLQKAVKTAIEAQDAGTTEAD
jgi:CheY-like chemotaxis protein